MSVENDLLSAMRHAEAGDIHTAADVYRSILERTPDNEPALQGLRNLAQTVTHQLSNEPRPTPDQFAALMSCYGQGDLKGSIELADKLLRQFPRSVEVYNIIGAALASHALHEKAAACYTQALQINPFYVDALNNLGAARKDLGQLNEAVSSYTSALQIRPDFAEAHNNLGIVLNDLGQPEQAISSSTKALQFKADFAEAHNNIGNAYHALTRPHDAIAAYTKAVEIKPDYAEAYINLGTIFKEVGRPDDAIANYRTGLQIKPSFADAHGNLGHILRETAQPEDATLSYSKALELEPDNLEYWQGIALALCAISFTTYNPKYAELFLKIIDKKTLIRPGIIAGPVLALLRQHECIKQLVDSSNPPLTENNFFEGELEKVICELSDIPLLCRILEVCSLPNLEFENGLKKLRRTMLFGLDGITDEQSVLRFQTALASQCWINEFVYGETEDESIAVEKLAARIHASFAREERVGDAAISCLASYRPLHLFEWSNALGERKALAHIFQLQVRDIHTEAALREQIPTLNRIKDSTSISVRKQYEQNPYPRWIYTNIRDAREGATSLSAVAKRISINVKETEILSSSTPDVLIAGCGTGQQSLNAASRFPHGRILAVDLSLSSLSYAKRKTEEFGVTNIDYMQADILDLELLDQQFDVVESTGVLHHMDDPMAGWAVLEQCLKPGGLMKIGLYSKTARKSVTVAREKIARDGISSSKHDILQFRADVLKTEDKDLAALTSWADIYSTSEFRDLVFHVKEHQFTLPQIRKCLADLKLQFVGFEFSGGNQKGLFKATYSDTDAMYNLDAWHALEITHPHLFIGMYQFWAQKPEPLPVLTTS